jgi:hypothetical protein
MTRERVRVCPCNYKWMRAIWIICIKWCEYFKRFSALNVTLRFITIFTRVCYFTRFWATLIQCSSLQLFERSILILYSLTCLRLGLPRVSSQMSTKRFRVYPTFSICVPYLAPLRACSHSREKRLLPSSWPFVCPSIRPSARIISAAPSRRIFLKFNVRDF